MHSVELTISSSSVMPPTLISRTGDQAARRFLEFFTVTFRATGITDYLTNGDRIEVAQRMAGHSNAETTGLTGATVTSAYEK